MSRNSVRMITRRLRKDNALNIPAELRAEVGIARGCDVQFKLNADGHLELIPCNHVCTVCEKVGHFDTINGRHVCSSCEGKIRERVMLGDTLRSAYITVRKEIRDAKKKRKPITRAK